MKILAVFLLVTMLSACSVVGLAIGVAGTAVGVAYDVVSIPFK